MQFNSIEFIFCFFPLFLLVYYCVRPELRSFTAILGSFLFYAFSCRGSYWWLVLLAGLTVASFSAGGTLAKPGRGALLAVYLAVLGGTLVFFKVYAGGRYLPSGMSFYLFQIAAYLTDVYRGRLLPERKLSVFTEQITLFPKLLSGPLMEPRQLQLQSRYVKWSFENIHDGLQQLILGLALKVLIANRLGGLWSQGAVVGYTGISTPFAWMTLIAYAMQLYFDFYGYSLMAMGIGRMLGYDLPANFLDPYASRSVSEFYRRWHVTLGAWFREYLYIPLGGNRNGTLRTIVNLAVVWLFTGLWHGVGGNYLLWAGFLFLLIVNERLWLGKLLKKTRVLSHVYTVFVILLSWLPFAVGDWGQMIIFAGRLFGTCGAALNPQDFVIWGRSYGFILAAGAVLMTPLPGKLWDKIRYSTFADLLLFVLFWAVIYFIATAAQDPFLYFAY